MLYGILFISSSVLYAITSSISQNSKGRQEKIFGYIGICSGITTISIGIFYFLIGVNVLLR